MIFKNHIASAKVLSHCTLVPSGFSFSFTHSFTSFSTKMGNWKLPHFFSIKIQIHSEANYNKKINFLFHVSSAIIILPLWFRVRFKCGISLNRLVQQAKNTKRKAVQTHYGKMAVVESLEMLYFINTVNSTNMQPLVRHSSHYQCARPHYCPVNYRVLQKSDDRQTKGYRKGIINAR